MMTKKLKKCKKEKRNKEPEAKKKKTKTAPGEVAGEEEVEVEDVVGLAFVEEEEAD